MAHNGNRIVATEGRAPAQPEDLRLSTVISAHGRATQVTISIPKFFLGQDYSRRIDLYGSKVCEKGPQGQTPIAHFAVGSSSADVEEVLGGVVTAGYNSFTVTDTIDGSTSAFSKCSP